MALEENSGCGRRSLRLSIRLRKGRKNCLNSCHEQENHVTERCQLRRMHVHIKLKCTTSILDKQHKTPEASFMDKLVKLSSPPDMKKKKQGQCLTFTFFCIYYYRLYGQWPPCSYNTGGCASKEKCNDGHKVSKECPTHVYLYPKSSEGSNRLFISLSQAKSNINSEEAKYWPQRILLFPVIFEF